MLEPKKDGSDLFCVHFRLINPENVPNTYTMTCMDDCLDNLGDDKMREESGMDEKENKSYETISGHEATRMYRPGLTWSVYQNKNDI